VSQSVEIDIATRFISDASKIYILFPGKGYRYYSIMRDEGVIFFDIAGFPFSPSENIGELKDIIQRIVISDRIREWHKKDIYTEAEPIRDPSVAPRGRESPRRVQLASFVKSFFTTLKKGDVIVVPPKSLDEDVLFGEVADDGSIATAVDAPFQPGEKIPGRRVKWLGTRRRIDVPRWLDRKIPSPNPLRQLEKSNHKYIYDIMYSRYYFDQQFVCKFNVTATDFSSLDNFLIQQIFLYASALFENSNDENIFNFSGKSISLVVSEISDSQDIPDQRIVISSPGYIVLYASNIVPLLSAVLIASSAIPGAGRSQPSDIVVTNSADSGTLARQCLGEIAREVSSDLRIMGFARWQELCKITTEAKKRTGLNSGMIATQSPSDGSDVQKVEK
jgi:hypothetical protein